MSAKLSRPPLTNKDLAKLTADEFARLKLTDDEKIRLREINRERARQSAEQAVQLRAEEKPIVADLRAIGCNVTSVWSSVKTSDRYSDAIPVLLKHLLLSYSDRTRGAVARALAAPAAKDAWPVLVEQYCKAPHGIGLSAKSGLAAALAETVTDKVIGELIALAKDRSHGSSRLLLLKGLRKSKAAAAKKALEELASDPELSKEIASWKKKK